MAIAVRSHRISRGFPLAVIQKKNKLAYARLDSLATACRVKFPLDNQSSTADVINGTRCSATIGSFREVIDLLPVLVPDRTKQLHIAQSASNGQLANVFVLYVKTHPAVENKLSLMVFVWALEDAGLMTETSVK